MHKLTEHELFLEVMGVSASCSAHLLLCLCFYYYAHSPFCDPGSLGPGSAHMKLNCCPYLGNVHVHVYSVRYYEKTMKKGINISDH